VAKLKDFAFMQSAVFMQSPLTSAEMIMSNKEALQCYFSIHDSQSTHYRFHTAIYHYLLIALEAVCYAV